MISIRKLILPLSILCILSLLFIVMQNWRKTPNKFSSWDCAPVTIIEERKGEALLFNVINPTTSEIVTHLAGSTDLVCDQPTLFIWDVNQDGTEDLYFQHCGGHGYLYCAEQNVTYKNLPDNHVSFKNCWYHLFYNDDNKTIAFIMTIFTFILIFIIAMTTQKK